MKAIAFDFDGTLLDSMGMWRNLGKNYLESRGIPLTEEVAKKINTMSLSMSSEFFKNHFGFQESVEEIYNEMGQILMKGYGEELDLKEGALTILEASKEKGLPLVLATATNEAFVKPALKRLGLEDYFLWIQTCDNTGIQKGDPAYYELLVQRLDLDPEDIVFLDDAPYALRAAKETGLFTIGVSDAFNQECWDQVLENSHVTIETLGDFLEMLES